jgi:hypothetical protein
MFPPRDRFTLKLRHTDTLFSVEGDICVSQMAEDIKLRSESVYVKREGHNNGLSELFMLLLFCWLVECQIKSMIVRRENTDFRERVSKLIFSCFMRSNECERIFAIWIKWNREVRKKNFSVLILISSLSVGWHLCSGWRMWKNNRCAAHVALHYTFRHSSAFWHSLSPRDLSNLMLFDIRAALVMWYRI